MAALANTIPVTIEDDLVKLSIRTNTAAIAESLEKLNNAISINARVLTSLCDEVSTMRAAFDMAQTRTQRRFAQMEEAHENLANEVQSNVITSIRTLQSKCAWKAEVNEELKTVSGRVRHCESFIEEIESGSGERVQKFVRGYVESFVPRWYETVAGPLWVRVTGAIAKASDETTKKANANLLHAEDRQKDLVEKLRTDHVSKMQVLDRKHTAALDALAESTKERFADAAGDLDATAAQLQSDAADAVLATHQRFCQVERAAHALRAALCLDEMKCDELMERALCTTVGGDASPRAGAGLSSSQKEGDAASDAEGDDSAAAAPSLQPNRSASFKATKPGAGAPSKPPAGPTKAGGGAGVREQGRGRRSTSTTKDKTDKEQEAEAASRGAPGTPGTPASLDGSFGGTARPTPHDTALSSSRVGSFSRGSRPSSSPGRGRRYVFQRDPSRPVLTDGTMAGDLASFLPVAKPGTNAVLSPTADDMPIGRILAEPRVLHLLNTPYFAALRTVVQDELEARVHDARTELQRDLSYHLLEVQSELKSKVNVRRLAEFLHENRDESLYASVRQLLTDMQELRMHKVDMSHFNEVLRQKADTKSLDLKADKQQVSTNVGQLTGRMDNVEHENSKQQAKMMETEVRMSELLYWLHTGKTMGDGGTGSRMSNQHAELLQRRPWDPPPPAPSSVVVEGSRREMPPGIAAAPGYAAQTSPDTQLALLPNAADANRGPEPRPSQSRPPTVRSSPKRGSSPRRGTRDSSTGGELASPVSSGRHAHHPQKRVTDGSPRDHLTSREGGSRESGSSHGRRPTGGLPPTMAEYVQLVAGVDPRDAGQAAPDVQQPAQSSHAVRAERDIPDGPPPRVVPQVHVVERVSWVTDDTADGKGERESPAAAAPVGEDRANAPMRQAGGAADGRPPSGPPSRGGSAHRRSSKADGTAAVVPTSQSVSPTTGMMLSSSSAAAPAGTTATGAGDAAATAGAAPAADDPALDDPRGRVGAWSSNSGPSSTMIGQLLQSSNSPDQKDDPAAPRPAATDGDAAPRDGDGVPVEEGAMASRVVSAQEQRMSRLLGSNVATVLTKTGAVTKDQMRKNDPLLEHRRTRPSPASKRR